ncbi:MAG: type II toxin-antitoxin system HicB family antitoxin [Chloroflexota bacterium]
MKVKTVLETLDEGGFTVYVPSLLGCISPGETEEKALADA